MNLSPGKNPAERNYIPFVNRYVPYFAGQFRLFYLNAVF